MSYGELRKTCGGFCPNFEICMGCFVHVILLGVGCFVSLQKNMWWFLSTYNKMDVGGYVRGVFCPYTITQQISRITGHIIFFTFGLKFESSFKLIHDNIAG